MGNRTSKRIHVFNSQVWIYFPINKFPSLVPVYKGKSDQRFIFGETGISVIASEYIEKNFTTNGWFENHQPDWAWSYTPRGSSTKHAHGFTVGIKYYYAGGKRWKIQNIYATRMHDTLHSLRGVVGGVIYGEMFAKLVVKPLHSEIYRPMNLNDLEFIEKILHGDLTFAKFLRDVHCDLSLLQVNPQMTPPPYYA